MSGTVLAAALFVLPLVEFAGSFHAGISLTDADMEMVGEARAYGITAHTGLQWTEYWGAELRAGGTDSALPQAHGDALAVNYFVSALATYVLSPDQAVSPYVVGGMSAVKMRRYDEVSGATYGIGLIYQPQESAAALRVEYFQLPDDGSYNAALFSIGMSYSF